MQRQFVTNLGLLLFLNLLIKPFWILGIDRTVQNVVGAEDYGLYYALFNFTFLLNIVLDVGITNFNTRNISQHQHLVAKHFSTISMLKLCLALVYIALMMGCGWVIGYGEKEMKFLLILAFNQFLISAILYLRSNLAGLQKFKAYSIVGVMDRALMILICGVLLWGNVTDGKFRIEWFVYAQTAAYVLATLIAFFTVIAHTKVFSPKFDIRFFLAILKKSFPFAVLILLMTFYNRVDTVMLERMLPDGDRQAGVYAQGYRILEAANMFAFLYAGLLFPIFSRMLKLGEQVEELLSLGYRLLLVPALIMAVACWFYRYELMELLYIEHIAEAAPVFGLLMGCFVAVSTTYVFGTLLTANGNLRELNIMAASGMLLNIALNVFLIPRLQAEGSAIASITTQFLTAIAQVLIVQHMFRFKVNYSLLFRLFSFLTGILVFGYFSRWAGFNWLTNAGIMLIASGGWALITRVVSFRSLYEMVRYREE